MDTLVTLGATAAMVDGIANFFLHHRAVFHFESAAMILTIITLGKWLESRATGRTSAALQKLLTLLPQTATVLRGGKYKLFLQTLFQQARLLSSVLVIVWRSMEL